MYSYMLVISFQYCYIECYVQVYVHSNIYVATTNALLHCIIQCKLSNATVYVVHVIPWHLLTLRGGLQYSV